MFVQIILRQRNDTLPLFATKTLLMGLEDTWDVENESLDVLHVKTYPVLKGYLKEGSNILVVQLFITCVCICAKDRVRAQLHTVTQLCSRALKLYFPSLAI